MDQSFYEEMTERSQVKVEIVRKYFWAWAKVMVNQPRAKQFGRIAYVDLFAGRGRYDDGNPSTPLYILESAIRDPQLREMLKPVFNDADPNNVARLQAEISRLPGIESLKHQPVVWNEEVGPDLVSRFEKTPELPPTLLFIDPWGYKGLSLRLVASVLRSWGCDCLFFFNYRRINMALSNAVFADLMDDLFGEEHARKLKPLLEGLTPEDRELAIVNALSAALQDAGGEFVLPFSFKSDSGHRTSHHLIFVSKNILAYTMMKEIMDGVSTSSEIKDGSFVYSPADRRFPLLFAYTHKLDALRGMLLSDFAGQTLTTKEIFETHHIGKPFVEKHYKNVLRMLEEEGAISTAPPAKERRKWRGRVTFPDSVKVTFPAKE